ncbi:MAG: YlbF family regulator [Oscillospiraceae bacterium]|nr:YlbF family regulator [Oscillospiraceae bacterium]
MDANVETPLAALVDALKASDTVRNTRRLKEAAYEDATNAALLDEYQRLQMVLQRGMLTGSPPPDEDMRRFQQIASLLMVNPDAQAYMLSQIKLQQLLAELVQAITGATGIPLPDLLGSS